MLVVEFLLEEHRFLSHQFREGPCKLTWSADARARERERGDYTCKPRVSREHCEGQRHVVDGLNLADLLAMGFLVVYEKPSVRGTNATHTGARTHQLPPVRAGAPIEAAAPSVVEEGAVDLMLEDVIRLGAHRVDLLRRGRKDRYSEILTEREREREREQQRTEHRAQSAAESSIAVDTLTSLENIPSSRSMPSSFQACSCAGLSHLPVASLYAALIHPLKA